MVCALAQHQTLAALLLQKHANKSIARDAPSLPLPHAFVPHTPHNLDIRQFHDSGANISRQRKQGWRADSDWLGGKRGGKRYSCFRSPGAVKVSLKEAAEGAMSLGV